MERCNKCGGMVIQQWFYGQGASRGDRFLGERCIRCGNIEDDVIRANRSFVPVMNLSGRKKGQSDKYPRKRRTREEMEVMK